MAYDPKPEAPAPPTIGFLRGQGLTSARIFCASIYCGRMVVMAFDDIGLPDSTPFPAIKERRRWACQRCGNREITVMPDWRDPREVQPQRTKQTDGTQGAYDAPLGGFGDDLLHLVPRSRSGHPG